MADPRDWAAVPPAASPWVTVSAQPEAADGTGGVWCSSDTDASLSVESSTPTAVLATGQTFLARGEYLFLTAGAASNCSVAFGTEINNSRVTLEAGSACFLTRLS